jgi:hypothetical protein
MVDQLKKFKDIKPADRALVLTKSQRQRLEAIFQAPIEDMDTFLDKIEALVTIQADKVKLTLSESQQKRLSSEAKFYKQEYPPYASKRIKDILNEKLGA